jgi:hypothetical protein
LATTFNNQSGPITASAVVSKQSGSVLAGILVNSFAATATIQLYDGGTVATPLNPIGGPWTLSASNIAPFFVPLNITLQNGLVIIIAVAAVNLTAIGRFSQ